MFRSREEYAKRYEDKVDDIADPIIKKKIKDGENILRYGDKYEKKEWRRVNGGLIRKLKEEVEEDIKNEIEEVKRNPNHWKNRVIKHGATTPLNEDEKRKVNIAVSYYDNFLDFWLYPYRRYDGSNKFVMRDYYETTDYYKNKAFKIGVYREDFEYNVHFWYWVNRYQNTDKEELDVSQLAHFYNNIDKVDIIDEQEREVVYIQILDEFHYAKIAERLEESKIKKKERGEFEKEEEERKWRENLEAFYQGGGHEEIINRDAWDTDQYIQETGDYYEDYYDYHRQEQYDYEYKTDERGYTREKKDQLLSLVRLHNLIPFDPEIEDIKTEMDHLSNQEDVKRYYRYKAYLKYILKEVPKSWKIE